MERKPIACLAGCLLHQLAKVTTVSHERSLFIARRDLCWSPIAGDLLDFLRWWRRQLFLATPLLFKLTIQIIKNGSTLFDDSFTDGNPRLALPIFLAEHRHLMSSIRVLQLGQRQAENSHSTVLEPRSPLILMRAGSS